MHNILPLQLNLCKLRFWQPDFVTQVDLLLYYIIKSRVLRVFIYFETHTTLSKIWYVCFVLLPDEVNTLCFITILLHWDWWLNVMQRKHTDLSLVSRMILITLKKCRHYNVSQWFNQSYPMGKGFFCKDINFYTIPNITLRDPCSNKSQLLQIQVVNLTQKFTFALHISAKTS